MTARLTRNSNGNDISFSEEVDYQHNQIRSLVTRAGNTGYQQFVTGHRRKSESSDFSSEGENSCRCDTQPEKKNVVIDDKRNKLGG